MAHWYNNRNRYRSPYQDPFDDFRDTNLEYRYNRTFDRRGYGSGRFPDRQDFRGPEEYDDTGRGFDTGQDRYYYDRDYDSRSYYGTTRDQGDWFSGEVAPSDTNTEYWFIPGPFQGIGPSGYQRSDERIKEDVHERLTRHGRIDARNIQVDVSGGEVTLKGQVHSRQEKRMAEDVADSVSGVQDVHNQLKIESKEQPQEQRKQILRQHEIQGGQVRGGMDVYGKNGEKIGTVKEIRQNSFLVDRSLARDVFVPFDQAHESNGSVVLEVTADQVDTQPWKKPDLF